MLRPFRHLLSSVCPSSDQKAAFIGFDIWPIKAAAQIGRRVKGITKNFSAHPGAGVKRGGIESARSRKKYPLTISGERVSLSHLNLMTLSFRLRFCLIMHCSDAKIYSLHFAMYFAPSLSPRSRSVTGSNDHFGGCGLTACITA